MIYEFIWHVAWMKLVNRKKTYVQATITCTQSTGSNSIKCRNMSTTGTQNVYHHIQYASKILAAFPCQTLSYLAVLILILATHCQHQPLWWSHDAKNFLENWFCFEVGLFQSATCNFSLTVRTGNIPVTTDEHVIDNCFFLTSLCNFYVIVFSPFTIPLRLCLHRAIANQQPREQHGFRTLGLSLRKIVGKKTRKIWKKTIVGNELDVNAPMWLVSLPPTYDFARTSPIWPREQNGAKCWWSKQVAESASFMARNTFFVGKKNRPIQPSQFQTRHRVLNLKCFTECSNGCIHIDWPDRGFVLDAAQP